MRSAVCKNLAMTRLLADPAVALREATARYRQEKRRAADIERAASEEFAAVIRNARRAGMLKSRIIVAIDNEWSRTWVDRACKEDAAAA